MSFVAVAIGASLAVVGGATSAVIAGSQAKKAGEQAKKYGDQLSKLEQGRQDLSLEQFGIEDLSGQIKNPYANLQVATKAAEMQQTQTDIALANTLDTLLATGAGAGGATALARAAALGKQGVAASIESQEAANARLRAQGEAERQARALAEQARVQQAGFTLGQMQESRDVQQLDRLAGLQQNQQFLQNQYRQQMLGAISSTTGDLASGLMGYATGAA